MNFSEYGFKYPDNLLMNYIGGSKAHGAKIGDTDDTDHFGVFVEPPICSLGIDNYPHFVYTTGGKIGGNGPQDIDVTLFSLRKFAGLAVKGNPSALHFLFAPDATYDKFGIWEHMILNNTEAFLSKGHVKAFLGFANDQMARLLGSKGQKNVHRKEIEDKFGFDTKYAMHVIRLYGEAIELMETGKITLPRPNKDELIQIRLGAFGLSTLNTWGQDLESAAIRAALESYLPEHVDREKVSRLIAQAQVHFFDVQRQAMINVALDKTTLAIRGLHEDYKTKQDRSTGETKTTGRPNCF